MEGRTDTNQLKNGKKIPENKLRPLVENLLSEGSQTMNIAI